MVKGSNDNEMPFTRTNYLYLLIGLAVLVVGYVLMSGGGSGDPNVFNEEEIFSARRITVAPIVILAGYIFIIHAIMKRSAE
ncbi:MAG: DUF3098 domain-containing protein [Flavobacteriales bacterium]|nr:DUF3098 domain-containing protein [Flavobacteriales bacterium]